MIAVDSSVLIDVLIDDPVNAEASLACVEEALAIDGVVVCEAVVAEVQAMLDTSVSLMDTLGGLGIRFEPINAVSSMRAGPMNKRFRARSGKRERVVADFLIGAHALLQCNALIIRDGGFFRDYFKGLKLIVPKAA